MSGAEGSIESPSPSLAGTLFRCAAWAIVDTDSHSATHSWFAEDVSSVKDQMVQSAAVDLTGVTIGRLTFWHRYSTESTFDGGVLEYSVDGGTSWFDMLEGDGAAIPANADRFLANGYNSTLDDRYSNPLPGRSAWSGSSGDWVLTEVDISDLAGNSVMFRWRMGCDASVSADGWWFDDITVLESLACTNEILFIDGFESGDTSAWSVVH
jgi:hypothetical protein